MSVLCAPQPYQHLMLLVFLTLAKMFLKGNSLSGSFTSCETWFSVSHFLNVFFVHLWTKYESESHSVLPNSLRPRGAPNVCPTSFAFASTFAVVVQSLSCVWVFATPWAAAHQASLSITQLQRSCKLMSIESVMPSNHLILYRSLFLLPSIFQGILSQFFTSGDYNIGASASA